eukprot:CAMPEP_0194478766 /NCGR_PEP_ID=MMETSP0253-20130528/2108_1 /TAXON_ID=2966 /ORGANISM="Noctiluca scintillans" /LENGTH=245 /DNA_ID=CAMNT_0039317909 /DNA_START=139 /DNA_END=876 /DNA_ORIENTATION=-
MFASESIEPYAAQIESLAGQERAAQQMLASSIGHAQQQQLQAQRVQNMMQQHSTRFGQMEYISRHLLNVAKDLSARVEHVEEQQRDASATERSEIDQLKQLLSEAVHVTQDAMSNQGEQRMEISSLKNNLTALGQVSLLSVTEQESLAHKAKQLERDLADVHRMSAVTKSSLEATQKQVATELQNAQDEVLRLRDELQVAKQSSSSAQLKVNELVAAAQSQAEIVNVALNQAFHADKPPVAARLR